jgi:hypothetical protein
MNTWKALSVPLIRIIGTGFLMVGVICAFLGPAETHAITFFQAGGRFDYSGFGFGSLMFANIFVQIAGYYVLVALCVPLGYGHLKLRWWAHSAVVTLIIAWLLVGLPFSLMALSIFVTSKEPTPAGAPFLALAFLLLYPILPLLLLRFYRSPAIRRHFRVADAPANWLTQTPETVKVATILLGLFVLVLHFPLLVRGFFPLFGRAVTGLPGVLIIDVLIWTTVLLTVGVARRHFLCWWCTVVLLALVTISAAVTFLTLPLPDIVAAMRLPPIEADALSGIPARGPHLAFLISVIPGVTFLSVLVARPAFTLHSRGAASIRQG